MLHHTIQGTPVPALGFGTWQLRGEACLDSVLDALALGYRHIDTAQGYDNEDQVGRALEASGVPRDAIFLVSKVRPSHYAYEDALRSSRESLRALGVSHIDLMLMHWPNPEIPVEETLEALSVLQQEGSIRHVGVSNFPPTLLMRAERALPLFANQVEYHPFLEQRALLQHAEELDLLLTAYSPVAKGAVADDPVLKEIAETHGKSPVQVALRWLIQQPRVAAIPKAATHAHRAANLDLFDFELAGEEMERIHALARDERLVDPPGGPDWERA